ncbi:hypothetical protein AD998_13205 [bacterium 336/3]|jgi:hypothetical protein|nr:hypothetical protein AD998_13205 [bacterium 336/3]
MRIFLFLGFFLLIATSSCVKKCKVIGCKTIQDHSHYFGGERGDGRPVTREEAIKEKNLKVVSGMPWYRRMFRKNYRTEDGLKYKRFDAQQHRAKNKEDYNTWSGKAKSPKKQPKG